MPQTARPPARERMADGSHRPGDVDPAGAGDGTGRLTIAGLTRATGLPRTTASRMVAALSGEHLLAAVDGRIRPGPALARLAGATARDVATTMRPHLVALAAEVRETVDLRMERQTVGGWSTR